MRNAFINAIIDACHERDDIFIISGDAGLGVFDDFKERYPDRFLNMGVAEQNTMSFAAGMSMAGYKVVTYNIIPFLLYRAYEQVRNDICYQELPVIMAGIGSGVTYAPQGMTHYSVEDVGIARTMPNLTVLSPIDPIEAQAAAHHALTADKPVYVRLAKRGEPNLHKDVDLDIAKPQMLEDGSGVALICHGSIGEEAVQAHRILLSEGLSTRLISIPMLQPLHQAALLDMIDGCEIIVTIEEQYPSCGLGAILTEMLSLSDRPRQLVTLGIPHHFIHDINTNAGMRHRFGIDATGIAATVRKLSAKTPKPIGGDQGCDHVQGISRPVSSLEAV